MSTPSQGSVAAGSRVGPYTILEMLGEGGFGHVYLAEQREPVQRRVALKILKAGMDSEQVVRRFEAERQALALMSHPCIAKVFDAGTTKMGMPYFVMEHVDGVPVTEYADQQRLDTRQRLELFREICRGVRHAHQKGVVHRDLKPNNVLVLMRDGKAAPKIIDFGIAKALDQRLGEQTVVTELRQIMGTPEYMAPEQADGLADVDTRADVYSLGVLLYELLTGSKPFELRPLLEQGLEEVLRHIREVTPPRPSTRITTLDDGGTTVANLRSDTPHKLRRRFRGDLDWIVLRALEKDRERRYQSTSELGEDVGRYLDNEPVLAGPPSAVYRLKKLAARHRVLVGATAAIAACLVASVGILAWSLGRVAQERDEADLARGAEVEARAEAEAALAEAEVSLGESEAVTEFLSETLASANPRKDGRAVLVRTLLDRSAAEIDERFEGQPRVETRLRRTIGLAYLELGMLDEAEAQLPAALELGRATLGRDGEPYWGLVSALARLREAQDRLDEAESLSAELVEWSRGAGGVTHGRSLAMLAYVYRRQGRLDEAEAGFLRALELLEAELDPDHRNVLSAVTNLHGVLWDQQRFEEAVPLVERVAEAQLRLHGPEHPDTLLARENLASLWMRQGRRGEALEESREILAIRRRILGDDHDETIGSIVSVVSQLITMGEFAEAEKLTLEGIERAERVLGARHTRVAGLKSSLGLALWQLGRPAEGEEPLLAAIEIYAETLGPEHSETLDARNVLAIVRFVTGRLDEAMEDWEALYEDQLATRGPEAHGTMLALGNLAMVYMDLGRFEEAEERYCETLELIVEKRGPEDPNTLDVRNNLANLLHKTGRLEEALAEHEEIHAIRVRLLGAENPKTLGSLENVAAVQQDMGQLVAAAATFRSLIDTYSESLGPEHPEVASCKLHLARLEWQLDQLEAAEAHAREAAEVFEAVYDPGHTDALDARHMLGLVMIGGEDPAQGEAILREVLEARRELLGEGHPSTLLSLRALGENLLGQGRAEEAAPFIEELVSQLRMLVAFGGATPEQRDELAGYLLREDLPELYDPERALRYARQACETTDQRNPHFLVNLARAQLATGEEATARETAARAYELMPFELKLITSVDDLLGLE